MAGEIIPAPLVASDSGGFTCSIAAVTRAAGGAGTAGTPVVITALVDSIPETYEADVENIKPMSMRGANNAAVNDDFTLEITEILYRDTAPKLPALFYTNLYFQVIVVGGLTPGAVTSTYWGIRAGGGRTILNGKSTFMLRIKRIETGQPNPLIVTA
jgi:hypothetical protein